MGDGPRVRGDRLVNADGSVFVWLADTWWWGASGRVSTADFHKLATRRASQGFTVIQLVVGLAGDVDADDPRQGNAGGPVFDNAGRPNSGYLDVAAERVRILLDAGLTPCIVGGWGYQLETVGLESMLAWWHALIERFAALPVVWCAAGEALMPHYSALGGETQDERVAKLGLGWSAVLAEIRRADPHRRPLAIHPSAGVGHFASCDMLDLALTDLVMLQSGHEGIAAAARGLELVARVRRDHPGVPVINAEVCYEGIMGSNWQDMQRFLFWTHLLAGAAGHSYGAHGLWAFDDDAAGTIGRHWGGGSWQAASRYPGADQLGLGRRLVQRWGSLEPAPEVVSPTAADAQYLPHASRSPDGTTVVYLPAPATLGVGSYLRALDIATVGRASWVSPRMARSQSARPSSVTE